MDLGHEPMGGVGEEGDDGGSSGSAALAGGLGPVQGIRTVGPRMAVSGPATPQYAAVVAQEAEATEANEATKDLPKIGWAAGLPKWVRILRRRMLTKEDWLHVHAASGLVRI